MPQLSDCTLRIGAQLVSAAYFRGQNIVNAPQFYYVPSHGQSLSIGDQGTPVVHTAETFGDTVSLFTGVPPIGSGFEVVPTESAFASLVNYKETSKETHGWSMFNWLSQKGLLSGKWLYGSYGVGGKTIAQLTDDPDPTGWGWAKVARGNAAAQALTPSGHRFAIPFATWIHGEADSAGDQAAYRTKLRSYHDRLMADTGQTFPLLIDQTGKVASTAIATTLLNYAIDNADCRMVLPKWWLNRLYYGDDIRLHLSPVGYQLQGEYFGRAAEKLINGEDYGVVYPQSWEIDSTYKKMRVNFHVPAGGNLVIDNDFVPAAPMLGLRSARPTYAATNPESYVQDGNTIEWTFAEPLTTDTLVELGRNLLDAANNGGVQLPCINLRDDADDDSIAVPGLKLRNWCCQRAWTPSSADGALNRFADNLWLHGDQVVADVSGSTIFAGRSTEWLLKNITGCTVTFNASITSGSAVFWCGNTSRTITDGVNTMSATVAATLRLYLISGSGGFSGSVTDIDVRWVS